MLESSQGDLYPLKFSVLALEKVWGGHKLAALFGQGLPSDCLIGEVWAVWDQLLVDNGPLRGQKLAHLVRENPDQILGTRLADRPAVFPLLAKFIDAREQLSVQVHPDDAYAQEHEGEPFGKAEAWYIIEAEPGAYLIHGITTQLTRSDTEKAIRTGTLRDLLDYIPVSAGDVIMNPPGTIHALGEGLLLYEIQQSSDLTYRLYDWDRNDPSRALHIEESLDVADLEPLSAHKTSVVEMDGPGYHRTLLAACQYFAAELLSLESPIMERPAGACFHVLTVLQGHGSVCYGPSLSSQVELSPGDSTLIPAGLGEYQLQARGAPFRVIKAYVPDLLNDIINPLRQRGIPDVTIIQLGGEPRNSDLGHFFGPGNPAG
jgi:mannose-6-phosphate isomerase